jgi:hypothetical protein
MGITRLPLVTLIDFFFDRAYAVPARTLFEPSFARRILITEAIAEQLFDAACFLQRMPPITGPSPGDRCQPNGWQAILPVINPRGKILQSECASVENRAPRSIAAPGVSEERLVP